jgi:hypothetical protein
LARYVFVGPSFLDWRPFEFFSRLRLSYATPLGMTVWRDATGTWQQKFAPTLDDLAGATVVYGGGRQWPLNDQQAADLTAGGYGAYITQLPGPATADSSLADAPSSTTG